MDWFAADLVGCHYGSSAIVRVWPADSARLSSAGWGALLTISSSFPFFHSTQLYCRMMNAEYLYFCLVSVPTTSVGVLPYFLIICALFYTIALVHNVFLFLFIREEKTLCKYLLR